MSRDLNRILKHAVVCPKGPDETFLPCLRPVLDHRVTSNVFNNYLTRYITDAIGDAPTPSMVKVLLDLGADPNATVEGASTWAAFLGEATQVMDGEHKEQCWKVLEFLLQGGVRLNVQTNE